MAELDDICRQCGFADENKAVTPNLPPLGPKSALVYVCGTYPDKLDNAKGRIFSGTSGRVIREVLKTVGIDPTKVRLYNAINCMVSAAKTKCVASFCAKKLVRDINLVKPKTVIGLGLEPVNALFPQSKPFTTLSNLRGASIPYELDNGDLIPFIPTYHPNYFNRPGSSKEDEQTLVDDVSMAIEPIERENVFTSIQKKGYFDECQDTVICKKWSQVKEAFLWLKDQEEVSFDFETTQLSPLVPQFDREAIVKPFSIAFSSDKATRVIPLYQMWSSQADIVIRDSLGKWFLEASANQTIIAHNLKFDLFWALVHFCAPYANQKPHELIIKLPATYHDTMLMAWLLDERSKASNLKISGFKYFGKKDWSVDVTNILKLPANEVFKYNGLDTWYTFKLYKYFWDEKFAQYPVFKDTYSGVMLPAVFAFLTTEARGVPINEEARQTLVQTYQGKIQDIQEAIKTESGLTELNPRSPQQLSDYFANTCRYKLLKQTAKGWSVDETALHHLVDTYGDKVAQLLLDYRDIYGINSKYISGLSSVMKDGYRIHPSYNLAGTVTGRTSSNSPNAQNFPKRDKEQKKVRRLVEAPPGFVLASFDYGQLEARLFAVTSGDPDYCHAMFNNFDIHLDIGTEEFGLEKAKELRFYMKGINFGTFYGGGANGLYHKGECKIPINSIQSIQKKLRARYPGIFLWQDEVLRFEKTQGYVESLFGRRRRSPMSYNEILNGPIQSTASDMTLTSMNALYQKYDVVFMIHDDLSFFLPEDEFLQDRILDIANIMLKAPWQLMHRSPWFKEWIPMQVECSIGNNWCDLEEVLKVDSLEMGLTSLDESLRGV